MSKLTVKVDANVNSYIPEYPFLGIAATGLVVLFNKPSEGTVIEMFGGYKIGEISNIWNMDHFKPFTGSITLTQT